MGKFGILLLLCLVSVNVAAQYEFEHYSRNVVVPYGIDCKLPSGYKDLYAKEYWKGTPHFKELGLFLCSPITCSKDEDCLLMYQLPVGLKTWEEKLGASLNGENVENGINTRHRFQMRPVLRKISGSIQYVFEDYVSVWSRRESKALFNADSVFIFTVPVPEGLPYRDKYTHAKCMCITRLNRQFMIFYWFFTEKGYKKADRHMRRLGKSIWYRDEWVHDDSKIEEAWKSYVW